MNVAGKVVLVTGAGSGMGREVALELLRRGASVAAVDVAAVLLSRELADAVGDAQHRPAVDDHPVVRKGLQSCLARQGHLKIVGEAADGDEALRKAREERSKTIDEAARDTKIRVSYLQALENESFDKLLGDNECLVKKLDMIPVECVVRNYAAGSLVKRLGVEEGMKLNPYTFELFFDLLAAAGTGGRRDRAVSSASG